MIEQLSTERLTRASSTVLLKPFTTGTIARVKSENRCPASSRVERENTKVASLRLTSFTSGKLGLTVAL